MGGSVKGNSFFGEVKCKVDVEPYLVFMSKCGLNNEVLYAYKLRI